MPVHWAHEAVIAVGWSDTKPGSSSNTKDVGNGDPWNVRPQGGSMTRWARRGRSALTMLKSRGLRMAYVCVLVACALAVRHPAGIAQAPGAGTQSDVSWSVSVPLVLGTGQWSPGVKSAFGISLQWEWQTHPQLVSGLGTTWARTSVRWACLEASNTTPENYRWQCIDEKLATLEQLGLTPIVLIYDNPTWASTTTCGPIDLVGTEEFGEFARALAERYDGDGDYDGDGTEDGPVMPDVTHWELYNEPDCHDEGVCSGGCWGDHGAEYARTLAVLWEAMHGANGDSVIVFGSIAAEPLSQWFNFRMDGGDFLDDVLNYIEAHPGTYFDWMAFHNYYAFEVRWEPYGRGIMGKTAYLRDRLSSHGLYRPVACTEVGLRSDKQYEGMPVGFEGQSRYVVMAQVRGSACDLRAITWYKMLDDPDEKWGLLAGNFEKNPSYGAYQTLTLQLSGAASNGAVSLGSGIEAYEFEMPNGTLKTVLWSTDEVSRSAAFRGSSVYVVDKYGVPLNVYDGGTGDTDGMVNGEVALAVGGSPLYVVAVGS